MANTKFTAVNCSPETKDKIDEYKKRHNLAQFEVLDYMARLLEESETNNITSAKDKKIIKELKKQTYYIKAFSEKLYALTARCLITLMMKNKSFDQEEAIQMAQEQAQTIVNEIVSSQETENNSEPQFIKSTSITNQTQMPEKKETLENNNEYDLYIQLDSRLDYSNIPKKIKNDIPKDCDSSFVFATEEIEEENEDDNSIEVPYKDKGAFNPTPVNIYEEEDEDDEE